MLFIECDINIIIKKLIEILLLNHSLSKEQRFENVCMDDDVCMVVVGRGWGDGDVY